MDAIEDMAKTGLVTVGMDSPLKRFAAVSALAGGLEFYFKPSYAFDPTGAPRPWSVTNPSESSTLLPFLMLPATLGLMSAVFI